MKLNEEIIWNLIDGNLPDDQQKEVLNAIEDDAEWKIRYQELLDIHKSLEQQPPLKPSLHFTDNVMKGVSRIEISRSTSSFRLRNINLKGLLITFSGILVGVLILSQGVLDFSILDYFSVTSDQLSNPVVDPKPLFNVLGSSAFVKGFLFLDAILAIFLVERYLFRPMVRSSY